MTESICEVSSANGPSRIALVVEYDGTRYCGFQYQPGLPTIQGELEQAITKLTGERRRVSGSGRTDAGVHASGQVVSFKTKAGYPTDVFVNALNYYLPEDIAVKEAFTVRDGFNARRHAVSREYEYLILNARTRSPLQRQRMWLVHQELDIEAMNRAGRELVGTHDFASFVTAYEKGSTRRTVHEARFEKRDKVIVFKMAADSFLAHQVRNTVGTLVQIGLGKLGVNHAGYLLERKTPGMAGPTAPAHGLYLIRVNYPQPLGAM